MPAYRYTWVQSLLDKLELRFSKHFVVDGIWVGVFAEGSADKAILAKLGEALQLIKAHDSYRYQLVLGEVGVSGPIFCRAIGANGLPRKGAAHSIRESS